MALRPEPILATLWLGALGSAVACLISFQLPARWDATRASMVTYLLPIVGVTPGEIVLGEQVDAQVVVGTALIVGGVAVVNLRRSRAPNPPDRRVGRGLIFACCLRG